MTNRASKLVLLALLALTLPAAGCGAEEPGEEEAAPPPPETQSYRNDEEGFSLDLPADWEVVEGGEQGEGDLEGVSVPPESELLALSPEAVSGLAEQEPAPILTVSIFEAPDDAEVEEWKEEATRVLEETNPDIENLSDRIVSLPPGEALELTFERPAPEDDAASIGLRQYVLRSDGKQYVLTFQTNAETLESDAEDFEAIADSFKLD